MIVRYNSDEIDEIVFELKNGKCAIIPTDTQIGIVAIKQNPIYKIKRRSKNKKIVLFVKDISYIDNPSHDLCLLANKYWPGKLTLIEKGISYRIPNTILFKKLLEKIPRLYCSSANISGQQPANSIDDAIFIFKNNLDAIIFVEDETYNDLASTVYNIDTHKVLREGKIKESEINEFLQKNNHW